LLLRPLYRLYEIRLHRQVCAHPAPRHVGIILDGNRPRGLTEVILLANGIPVELLVDLVRAGLATATAEQTAMGRKTIEVARVRITEEGRRVLNGGA
jgi:hypothetical protein